MYTNHTGEYTAVRDMWHNLDIYKDKICTPIKEKVQEKVPLEEVSDTVSWLMQPESREDLPQPVPKRRPLWANAVKTLLWAALAIFTGLLIAQLSG